eukprot:TRINITY_DN1608_c0_g1_i1.p1 TRINITY_DN1608_c0_g1~~TRINITY_DN1608_c0_g1_i1.p1  ORF type:complete len:1163 (+),score=345.20 TRINITY_DN1608_c0_g1_i1:37-3525(+)
MGFLVQLELENFKSYRGKQIIGPFKKFTAIIGPNGVGKSNLMDAISFVLGEKTSNLRVKQLKDLIHGAQVYKPVANRAHVTALYQDDDDSVLEFTRTIIGSGSEYKINGEVVSHTEYNKKLESIGIYVKAKNFLVFQGAIEAIAMKTPKERSHLFEEISRSGELTQEYEEKRVSMLKTQEETTTTYHKKKAILTEKKDAKAEKDEAEKYQKLKNELVKIQTQEKLFLLYHAENSINNYLDQLGVKRTELNDLAFQRGNTEQSLKDRKQKGARLTREMATIDKIIKDKEADVTKSQPNYIKAREKTAHVQKKVEQTKKQYEKAMLVHKRRQSEIESLEKELEEVKGMLSEYEVEATQESQEYSLQLQQEQMEEYHRLKEKVCTQATQLHQKLESVQREQRLDEENVHQCKQRTSELQARRQQLVDQRTQLQNRLDHLDSYLDTNLHNVDDLKHEKEAIEQEVSQANLRCKELNEVMERINDDLKDARVDRHESSRSQRKAENLESMKRLFPGVYGRVIELTEPIHRKYAVALTKVLGKNMDAIIVDTENTGKECIQYLKEMRAESETFLPLNTIKANAPKEMLRKLGGTSKLLIDAIKWDPPEIKRALQFACGSAIVCDTMEEARKIAFMSGDRERKKVVSLDGTLFQKSGVISGGASEIKHKAKRWDEKQIDILKRNQEKYLDEFKELTRVKRKGTNVTDLETRIFGLESRLKYTQKDRDTTFNESMPHNQQELESTEERLSQIEPEEDDLQRRIEQRNIKLGNIQSQIYDVEDSVFNQFCKRIGVSNIRQYEEKELRSQQERSKKKLEFSNQISRLQNQLQYEKNRSTEEMVTKLEQQIKNEEDSIENLKKEEKKSLRIIDRKDDDLKETKVEREEKKKEVDEHETSIKDLRKSLTQTTKDIAAVHKQITNQESELESKRAERHNILKDCKIEDIRLPLLEGEIESVDTDVASSQAETLEDNMDVDLPSSTSQSQSALHHILKKELNIKIDFTQLVENLKETQSAGEVKEKASELKRRVAKLESLIATISAPNMKAMQRLDGVENKVHEINAEHEAARVSAKKSKAEFEQIKKKRCYLFNASFDHVSTQIDPIYKELSNNTSAQAFLGQENAEEPYLDGISYSCVAPGKRYRPMDNLSGGEKTVAALALLFSIHRCLCLYL